MVTNIFLFLTILAYSIVVSQSFMYILALKHAQIKQDAYSYLELRKLIDAGMNKTFRYVMYAALFANIALLFLTVNHPGSLLFITILIALVALVTDTMLAIKGSIPVNQIIASWSKNNYPANWADYRTKWFGIFQYRQLANISGFISLLIGAVFG